MGILKAITTSVTDELRDQYKEYFYCGSIPTDVLALRGYKNTSARSVNNGDDNIITDGSVVVLNEGQALVITENGKVVDSQSEPGAQAVNTSAASVFGSDPSSGFSKSVQNIGRRISFGGVNPMVMRLYYFNTKEIMGNKFETKGGVAYRAVDNNIGLDIDVLLDISGEYSYRIVNPELFYKNVCGNISYQYTRDKIDSQLTTEILTHLAAAFARLSHLGLRESELVGHTLEIADALNVVLSDKWRDLRGIEVVSFGISELHVTNQDSELIKQLQRSAAIGSNPSIAGGMLLGATAQAMGDAAKNKGGALGMWAMSQINSNQSSGLMNAFSAKNSINLSNWTCECGTSNSGNFCTQCGKQKNSRFTS